MPETEVIRPQRGRFALGDMFRSLGLIVVIVAAILLIGPARSLILPTNKDRMPPADYAGAVIGFDDVASSRAVVPTSLPTDWRANATNVNNIGSAPHLHIGWAVPGAGFAGLDETTGSGDALLRSVTGRDSLQVRSTTTVAGQLWQVRRSDRGETVLTHDANGTFVVITGNATDTQLRLLASSLH